MLLALKPLFAVWTFFIKSRYAINKIESKQQKLF